MSRIISVRDNWKEITNRLLADKQELAHFLRFSARMYKQSFSDAVLIYQQNPNATKVAELSTWNKLGRIVNKGERSVAVFGEGDTCRYMFDVSQTNGKRLPELWKLDESLSAELTALINKKYGKGCKNIQETIAAMSIDNVRSHLTEMMASIEKMKLSDEKIKIYQQSFVSAVRFVVSNRCELGGDMKLTGGINLNAVDLFRDNKDLIRFCDLVQKSAKDTLLEMEREIVQILKQRREKEYGIQNNADRTVESGNRVHGRPEGSGNAQNADRQVGQTVAGVGKNGVPDRGDSAGDGRTVAVNTAGNRHRSGKPLSGAGRAVPQGKSTTDDIQRDTGVGENAPADDRTQSNERGSISVEGLIERYKNADFNRRLDNYEFAGYMLYEAQINEWKGGALDYFKRFEADDFSAEQAAEIIGIIEAAVQNKDISAPDLEAEPEPEPVIIKNSIVESSDIPMLNDQSLIESVIKHERYMRVKHAEIAKFFSENEDYDKRAEFMKNAYNPDYSELLAGDTRLGYKTVDNGLLIWEGSYLSRTSEVVLSWGVVQAFAADLIERGEYVTEQPKKSPPKKAKAVNNELHILSFLEQDGQIYAACVKGAEEMTIPVERTEDDVPYLTVKGKPTKLTDMQLRDLEQFEIFRSPIVHDINGFYAEDLDEGDKIRLEGEIWTINKKDSYHISMTNENGEKKILHNTPDSKWAADLTKAGFEYIPEMAIEIDKPIFAEPVKSADDITPEPEVEQLTFFGEPLPVEKPKRSRAAKKNIAVSNTAPTQDMIDHILRGGSNEPYSLERIVAQFQKGKSIAENAEFLRKEFGENGRGFKYSPPDFSSASLVAAWFDNSGITAAINNTAFPDGEKTHLSWEQVSERIGELLDSGNYCSQDVIDRAADNELTYLSGQLWYLHQDYEDESVDYFIPKDMFAGGFPDSTERIKASLLDKDILQKYIDGLSDLVKRYEKDRDILRFHFHKPKELLGRLKDLQIERKEFITNADFRYEPKYFITEDEKDWLVSQGSVTENSKFRIAEFFTQEHTAKEKADFLKREHGVSGRAVSGSYMSCDSKGINYQKGEHIGKPDCSVLMKWNEAAERTDRLISEGKFITQRDIDERIRNAKYILKNYDEENPYEKQDIDRAKKILSEYGITVDEQQKSESADEPAMEASVEKDNAPIEERPVETAVENIRESAEDITEAVFMDTRDEGFILVQQTDEGIDYVLFTSDLMAVDGGVWEMDEYIDLKTAAAELLDVSESTLLKVPDSEKFFELAYRGDEHDEFETEFAELKAEIFSENDKNNEKEQESEKPTEEAPEAEKKESVVNAPERISPPVEKEPKSGIPYTYHFSEADVVTGGAKARFKANIEAIKTLQKIEAENRYATPEEQSVMARYVGWGGIQQAFVTDRAAESIGNLGEAAPSGWESEQQQLLELLSPEEYKAARASTATSFYSPPDVTSGIYQALEQFGFEGGNVLEPSMGVGNFFAKMPEEMRDNSRLYGVEIDSISGRIAQQLYPNERIQIKGFEQTSFNNNSFDVVIGNIPFGDYRVFDKSYNKLGFKIHDYFAAKSVDKVKPGGVVALVTSKFTMDKQSEKVRRYLAERCDLLGAVRLPAGTFKDADSVTTDILFLKKRETLTAVVPDWVHMSETPDNIPCNKYFVDNPDMVLGTMAWDERMKGKYGDDSRVTTCYANEEKPLAEQINEAVAKIKGSIETVREKEQENSDIKVIPADPSVRNFTHTIVDGELYFRENEIMTKVQETGKTLDRMMGMHKIRQAAMAVIDAQAENCSDEELKALQAELNAVYDKFRRAYGNITDSANERCFKLDDDYNTLAALEIIDAEKKTIEKAEIFTKRTILPEVEIASVDTPQEALQVSIDRLGKVDIPYMAKLVGCEPEKLIADLGNDIYRDPAKIRENDPFSGYQDASEYLSGNVREKLRIAQEYTKHIDSSFQRNVEALEKVLPRKLEASEISVRIGANWIDVADYNRFLKEYAGADTGVFGHPVTRTRMGEYKIEGKYQDRSLAATEKFGTSRMSSYHIFENLLNQRDIVIRDKVEVDGKETYVINTTETRLAKEKARLMKEAFKSWVWDDIDRREKYVEKYNNLFNAIRGREYDGSHQTFPGMNPAIKLRPHQENAVLRAKLGGNTLLAHCVGAGKSFEMIAATMEKKRLGLINKGCIVVPKHLTLQMASEWMRLYPNAKLLVARPEDFEKNNRQKFIARCVTGDYDAVIMSFTQFERIPMSDEYRQQFMEKEIAEIEAALEETDDSDRVSVKALERQKRKIEERMEKLLSSKKDNSLCFEKLGFDYLVCDEAHYYKNCYVATKMSNVAGVQTTAAQKSEDMLMKTQYLNEKYGCNNILLSTGTPISNSMVEFYVMQRYLRPDLLEKAGLETFDDWAGAFGEVVSQLEMKPAGNGYQLKNRFSKFVNIPELMQMFKEFADVQTPDMIKLPVPKLKGGEPIVVIAKPDDRQKAYMKELARRSEAIHSGNIDPSEDNMLKITYEARLLGLDSRCIFKDAEPAPDSKVMQLIDNLEKNYNENADKKGVQIIFCDMAINEDSEHFSVYEAIKSELVRRGIPREEICFAGDAKTDKARVEMFEQLRKGEKRFIIASTTRLGTGANVQDKICAIHHLDIPWKPSDLIQQDGRGVRQGNTFDEVAIYHYLTENTFDAYAMGIITNKAKFINQIMTSKEPVRVAEDVDEMVLTYSQMQAIASGNPMIKEKIQLDNDVAMLKTLESEHKKSMFKMQEFAERILPERIENYANLLQKASNDLKAYQEQHPDNTEFSFEIEGQKIDERAKIGEIIEKAIVQCSISGESIYVGKYFGFDVSIEANPRKDSSAPCVAVLQGNLKYTTDVSVANNVGNVRRIENLADIQINQKIQQFSANLDKAKADLEDARSGMSKPFERAAELQEKLARLEFVNQELSKSFPQDDDEPILIDDTPDDDEPVQSEPQPNIQVTVAIPAMAGVTVPDKPPSPQLDKPKQINNKIRR